MARILIVEDDRHQRLLLEEELTYDGHVACSAESAEEALDLAGSVAPDVIVLDIGLPSVGSMKLAWDLGREHGDVPLVVYTAYQPYRANFLRRVADAYVLKQSDLSKLKDAIKDVLGKRRGGQVLGATGRLPAPQRPRRTACTEGVAV